MLSFAVVVSCGRGPVPDPVVERLRRPASGVLPFPVRSHRVWSNPDRSVWFGGWQDTDEQVAAHHWHVDGGGVTAFSGHVWPRRDGWLDGRPWAAQLAARFGEDPSADRVEELGGVFVATVIDRDGRGQVFSNAMGIGAAYRAVGREVTVISTRPALAAHLLAAVELDAMSRDVFGVGWLAYCGHAMGSRTGFSGVETLPAGMRALLTPHAGPVVIVCPARTLWRPGDEAWSDPEPLLDETRAELETSVRMGMAAPGRVHVADLTGGKDTRLLLAVLLDAGLTSDLDFECVGADDLPDVQIAQQLADDLGLRFSVNAHRRSHWQWYQAALAQLADSGHADLSPRELGFRLTTWAGSGCNNITEPLIGRLRPDDRVRFTALFGETLRTNYPSATAMRSKWSLGRRLPPSRGIGGAGIMRAEVAAQYRSELHRLLFDGAVRSDSPQDVADVFFIHNRLHRWYGTKQELDVQPHLLPLGTLAGLRLGFAIGAENRHAEWIHRRIMHDVCPMLVELQFVKGSWPDGSTTLAPPRRHHDRVPRRRPRWSMPRALSRLVRRRGLERSTPARTVGADRLTAQVGSDIPVLRRLLGDPANPVSQLLDPAGVERALETFPTLGHTARQQVYGAATAAIWLGGEELPLPHA